LFLRVRDKESAVCGKERRSEVGVELVRDGRRRGENEI
jgi:hypothetical protein